jgi:hypothetical protein
MSLDFLRNNGASRVTSETTQPDLLTDTVPQDPTPEESIGWDVEVSADEWQPIDVHTADLKSEWAYRPERFVDGKDVGHTVAWLRSPEGYPVPVRLAQIGAVVMREVSGQLRREFELMDRIVVMSDLFPWDEVESFARALQVNRFRLLLCGKPEGGWSYLYEPMRKATQNRSNDEMIELEKLAFSKDRCVPTILDGRLVPRASIPTDNNSPVIGVIKTHARNYLHRQGWQVYYNLEPGQRTPAFRLENPKKGLNIISWFLRLDGNGGAMPNWGVVRLEMPEGFFVRTAGGSFDYINHVSHLVYDYRCRDDQYRRAPVSLYPIQRAEENLGALFTQSEMLIHRFYHLTNL